MPPPNIHIYKKIKTTLDLAGSLQSRILVVGGACLDFSCYLEIRHITEAKDAVILTFKPQWPLLWSLAAFDECERKRRMKRERTKTSNWVSHSVSECTFSHSLLNFSSRFYNVNIFIVSCSRALWRYAADSLDSFSHTYTLAHTNRCTNTNSPTFSLCSWRV